MLNMITTLKIIQISIIGRVAIGIECLETMVNSDYKTEVHDFVLNFLYQFVENDNIVIVDWEEIAAEITPDTIINTPYSSEDFELINKDFYNDLSCFYKKIGSDCCVVIDKIIEIASLHFYTTIPLCSFETAKLTKDILCICHSNIGYLPNIDNYKKSSFKENHGWGRRRLRTDFSNSY